VLKQFISKSSPETWKNINHILRQVYKGLSIPTEKIFSVFKACQNNTKVQKCDYQFTTFQSGDCLNGLVMDLIRLCTVAGCQFRPV